MVGKILLNQHEHNLTKKIMSCSKEFLPNSTTFINVHDIQKLDTQGRSSIMYNFFATFYSKGSKQQKEFILRIYKKENLEKGRKEFSLLKVLKEHNLPVPTVYCFEENREKPGRSFMIMERIIAKDASIYLNNEDAAKRIIKEMAKCLAIIHEVKLDLIKNSDFLLQEYEQKQELLMEIRSFINKRSMRFLGFCPPPQRRFIAAVERLGYQEPRYVKPTLLHLDYEPNHVIVLDGRCVVVDWGEASIGDPAYDVSWAYHKLRLGKEHSEIDWGDYFVKCYEKYSGQELINLQFFKDLVAIEMANWCGLSPFKSNRLKNYRKLLALFFGDAIGIITRAMYVHKLRRNMANHHTEVWRNVNYIKNYTLRYLEKDRYSTLKNIT